MEFLKPLIGALRNAPAYHLKFLLWLALIVFLLRKIKVRRPRSWYGDYRDAETPSDNEAWDAETPSDDEEWDEETPSDDRAWDEETPSDDEEWDEETPSRQRDKGRRGEDLIEEILYDSVAGEFALFRNAYVPKGGGTSEIDLLMIHEKGVFVFESKNYNGLVSGSMGALNWVHIHPNRKRYSFYNPVRQNANHIKALSRYLRIPERRFFSYIVFSDSCRLDRVPENTRSVIITQTSRLEEDLKHTLSASPALYDAEEVGAIADRIVPLTNVGAEVKAKHIADIRDALESDVCPFCGAELVLRRGKRGAFWGCSSYPKCKFKRTAAQ